MNDSRKHDERLIVGIFHDDWDRGTPAQLAGRAAAAARKQRLIRHVSAAFLTCAAILGTTILALYARTSPRPTLHNAEHLPKYVRNYEIISDAELLARMHDRSVVMVKRSDGTNEFVLIGQ